MKIRGCWFILWPFRPTEGYRKNGDYSYIYKTDVLCFEFMYIGWDSLNISTCVCIYYKNV